MSEARRSQILLFSILFTLFSRNALGEEVSLGKLTVYAHGVRSDEVKLFANDRKQSIIIKNFYYDGTGPDAFFTLGKKEGRLGERDNFSENIRIPNENKECGVLVRYDGQDIELDLPTNVTIGDYRHFAIYCYKYQHLFAYAKIPPNLSYKFQVAPYSPSPIIEGCSGAGNGRSSLYLFLVVAIPAMSIFFK